MTYLKQVSSLRMDSALCTGCGRCLEVCPRAVFAREGKVVAIRALDNCLECGACVRNCEFGALTVNPGVGCAAALIRTYFDPSVPPTCGCGEAGIEPAATIGESCCSDGGSCN